MLPKRTNILFSDKMWAQLIALSRVKKQSIGSLVREAITKVYISPQEAVSVQKAQAIHAIQRTREGISHDFTQKEIKQLIQYGRKH